MKHDLLKRFSAAVLALNDCPSPTAVGPALVGAMSALFEADMHVAGWIGPGDTLQVTTSSVPYPREARLEVLSAHFREHPLRWVVERARAEGVQAGRWSDTTTLREFQQTALYHEYYRHMGTRHQLGFGLRVSKPAVLSLTFNRNHTDFQPDDARVLEAFAPHVAHLIRRMKGRMEVENALALHELAASREAIMIVDDEGALRFATERARQFVRDSFPDAATAELPQSLRAWLACHPCAGECLTQPLGSGELSIECVAEAPALANGMDETLFQSAGIASGLRLLRLAVRPGISPATTLEGLGLTARQAEVLYWMVQGKRNDEIAIILGTSPRTVDKHRENLFARLGVETRTAAVAAAWKIVAGD